MRRPATRPVFFATIVAIAGLLMLAFQIAGSPPPPALGASTGTLAVARAVHAAGAVAPVVNCAQLQAMEPPAWGPAHPPCPPGIRAFWAGPVSTA